MGFGSFLFRIRDVNIIDTGRFELRANRDQNNGYPVLDESGDLLVKGRLIKLTADQYGSMYLFDRGSNELAFSLWREAVNTFKAFIYRAGQSKELINIDHKNQTPIDHPDESIPYRKIKLNLSQFYLYVQINNYWYPAKGIYLVTPCVPGVRCHSHFYYGGSWRQCVDGNPAWAVIMTDGSNFRLSALAGDCYLYGFKWEAD